MPDMQRHKSKARCGRCHRRLVFVYDDQRSGYRCEWCGYDDVRSVVIRWPPKSTRVLTDLQVDSVSFLADPPEHNVVLSVRPVEGPSEPSPNAACPEGDGGKKAQR